jgi:hypothetical protein
LHGACLFWIEPRIGDSHQRSNESGSLNRHFAPLHTIYTPHLPKGRIFATKIPEMRPIGKLPSSEKSHDHKEWKSRSALHRSMKIVSNGNLLPPEGATKPPSARHRFIAG